MILRRALSVPVLVLPVFFLTILVSSSEGLAATYLVDPNAAVSVNSFRSLSDLLAAVSLQGGDVVQIKTGTVFRDRIKFTYRHSGVPGLPVIIESTGPDKAVWDGSSTNVDQYGYLWQFDETSHDIEVRRIEIRNVQPGPDRNNRGLYVRGVNISVREFYVHHNPVGITSAVPARNTIIEFSEVAWNGLGDGYTHNFYMQGTGTHIRHNYIHDPVGGINYKDRSLPDEQGVAVEFSYNRIENAPGAYELDFSLNNAANGAAQDAYLVGNIIIKSAAAANYVIAVFGNDGRRGTLHLSNNTIIAGNDRTRLLALAGGNTAEFSNNIYYGSTRLFASGSAQTIFGTNNWLMAGAETPGLDKTLFGTIPGFVNPGTGDFHLAETSAAIGKGSADLLPRLIPQSEFASQGTAILRQDSGTTIGAFAFSSTTITPPAPRQMTPRPLPLRRTGPRRVLSTVPTGN